SRRRPRRELLEHQLRNAFERFEYSFAVQGVRAETRQAAEVEGVVQIGGREDQLPRQVLLVVLQHQRDRADVYPVLEQIALQILQALQVLVELARLAVAYEHDAVRSLQHEAARRVVIHLARHGVELEPGRKPGDLP